MQHKREKLKNQGRTGIFSLKDNTTADTLHVLQVAFSKSVNWKNITSIYYR